MDVVGEPRAKTWKTHDGHARRRARRLTVLFSIVAVGAAQCAVSDGWKDLRFPDDAPRHIMAVEYARGELPARMPLGGLGTGAFYLDAYGRFSGPSIAGTWRPSGGRMVDTGFDLVVGSGEKRRVIPFEQVAVRAVPHFPMLDLHAANFAGDALSADLRAIAVFLPGNSRLSGTPAVLFRIRVRNAGRTGVPAGVRFRWTCPQPPDPHGRTARGNVDGFLVWSLGSLEPGRSVSVPVILVTAERPADLPRSLTQPTGDVVVDDDGQFNWEDTRRQCLHGPGGPCLSQHGFRVWYRTVDGARRTAGTRVVGRQRLDRLQRLERRGKTVLLRTTDGALEVRVTPAPGTVNIELSNVSKTVLPDVRLGFYANLEAAHDEVDDSGWLDPDLGAVIVTDPAGPVCALASTRPPDGGRIGTWGKTLSFFLAGRFLNRTEWPAPARSAPTVDAERRDSGLFVTWRDPAAGHGCTVGVRAAPGLSIRPVRGENDARAGRIGVDASGLVPPGGTRTFQLVLAWYYPDARETDGKAVGRMYSNWFANSAEVAEFAMSRWDEIAALVGRWQEQMFVSGAPGWLTDVALNSLAILVRNSAWLKDGRFTVSESFVGCPITETIVCRFYGSTATAMFFPDLEKNTMRQFMRRQRKDGAIPFAFGRGERWDAPYYETQKILDSSEFVIMAWRDAYWWDDDAWAKECLPAVRRAIAFARSLDTDGDGVINDELSRQYYDCWQFYGVSAYTGGVWLAALKSAAALARRAGDDGFAAECDGWFERAAGTYEEKLWTGRYYRLYNDTEHGRRSDTCLAGQFAGQWAGLHAGLGLLLPKDHVLTALRYIDRMNGANDVWALVNGITPDGRRDQTGAHGHSETATLGETWCFAAACLRLGLTEMGLRRARRLAENIALVQRRPWDMTWNIDPDTGRYLWGSEYYSNLCVWDLWRAAGGDFQFDGKRGPANLLFGDSGIRLSSGRQGR